MDGNLGEGAAEHAGHREGPMSEPEYICTRTEKITRRFAGILCLGEEKWECEHEAVEVTKGGARRHLCIKCNTWLDVPRSTAAVEQCVERRDVQVDCIVSGQVRTIDGRPMRVVTNIDKVLGCKTFRSQDEALRRDERLHEALSALKELWLAGRLAMTPEGRRCATDKAEELLRVSYYIDDKELKELENASEEDESDDGGEE